MPLPGICAPASRHIDDLAHASCVPHSAPMGYALFVSRVRPPSSRFLRAREFLRFFPASRLRPRFHPLIRWITWFGTALCASLTAHAVSVAGLRGAASVDVAPLPPRGVTAALSIDVTPHLGRGD